MELFNKIGNIGFVNDKLQKFYDRKWNCKKLLPFSISKTYDKEVKKLADILFNKKLSHDVKKNFYNEFRKKFTIGFSIRIEWYKKCMDELETNGTVSDEVMRQCEEEIFGDFFVKFPRPNQKPHFTDEKGILNSHINFFRDVFLQTLVENDFDYEDDMNDICCKFWNFNDDEQDKKVMEYSILWYKINISNYKAFKNLPKIEESLNNFHKIRNIVACGTVTQWIKALKETENAEYISLNIDHHFGFEGRSNTEYKQMWEYFIEFSRELQTDKRLNAYSRYCRLYIDDSNRRKEYQKEIENTFHQNFDATKWMLDLIKLEYEFGSKSIAKNMLKKYTDPKVISTTFNEIFQEVQFTSKAVETKTEKTKRVSFETDGMITQSFPYPNPIIKYICKNGNYNIIQKLQCSSKQLFLSTNQILCCKFSVSDLQQNEIFKETLFISATNPNIEKVNNIFIFNTLFVSYQETDTISKFIPKIAKCTLRFLILRSQNLTWNEYDFLTNSKTIEGIVFEFAVVTTSKNTNERACLEEMMKNLPNAKNFVFVPSPFIHFDTFDILVTFKRNIQIDSFHLSSIKENFSSTDFCCFLNRFIAPNSRIYMYYDNDVEYQYLLPSIKKMLDFWEPRSEIPCIKIEKMDFQHTF